VGRTTLSWTEENQLKQIDLPTGLTVNYKYDALGRRLQRTTGAGANERYVYDGADVLLDLNANWSVATTYLNGPGIDNHLRQTSTTTGVSYYLSDHLGSTAGMTDASGILVDTDSYDSFGNSTGSARTRYGYTGRERDPDSGLMYYRARWYDPQVGRFISEDPIEFGGGLNWYVYAINDPLKFKDPEGLRVWVCSRLTYALEKWVGANHSYLFDDRNSGQSCGLSGPRKSRYPFYGSTEREKGPNEGATCRPVDGSDDPQKADEIMSCCRNYKATSYVPWLNDCHNLTHSCVTNAGLKDPGAPGARLGERCVTCSSPPPPKVDWNRSPKCWGGARGC
jgi:RHS repeat-associated protein